MLRDHERDTLQRFLFDHAPVRGEGVHLDTSWRVLSEHHGYPPVVRDLLGEMMAASALLASTLKFDGRLTIQAQGDGHIPLIIMEATSERTLRGLAHWRDNVQPAPLAELLGKGYLAITIEPRQGRERYQGIVGIEGDTLAECLQNYLLQSEQLDTHIWLAADNYQAAGLLLQKMPEQDQVEDHDCWNRVVHLANTITPRELLELPTAGIVHRLFHEEDVRLFDSLPISFRCSCSRERVADMLRNFGIDEVHKLLDEQNTVEVTCEYCNQPYAFDRVDAEQVFAAAHSPDTPPTQH
ncbi:MAG: molecular chaperone Hsp33 [Gammaproteobacteria bacterium RBG_16_57_12]|nr:MAG: molecular chaperone Hsp33 [Gammaproteobacteria bacterium RBG_16_57_12]